MIEERAVGYHLVVALAIGLLSLPLPASGAAQGKTRQEEISRRS